MVKRHHTCLASRNSGFEILSVHRETTTTVASSRIIAGAPSGAPDGGSAAPSGSLAQVGERPVDTRTVLVRPEEEPRRRGRTGKAAGFHPAGRGSRPRCGSRAGCVFRARSFALWRGQPTDGDGRSFENCRRLRARAGSTPASSAIPFAPGGSGTGLLSRTGRVQAPGTVLIHLPRRP